MVKRGRIAEVYNGDLLHPVEVAAKAIARKEAEVADARRDLKRALQSADQAGVPRTVLADAAKLDRSRLTQILGVRMNAATPRMKPKRPAYSVAVAARRLRMSTQTLREQIDVAVKKKLFELTDLGIEIEHDGPVMRVMFTSDQATEYRR